MEPNEGLDALNVLQRLGRGDLINEIHAAILDVAGEVAATGKAGSVTVTLKISHPPKTDPLLVVIDEEVKRGMPKSEPRGAMFFTLDAQLHDRDPRQPELPTFRVVDDGKGTELRDAEPRAGEVREAE